MASIGVSSPGIEKKRRHRGPRLTRRKQSQPPSVGPPKQPQRASDKTVVIELSDAEEDHDGSRGPSEVASVEIASCEAPAAPPPTCPLDVTKLCAIKQALISDRFQQARLNTVSVLVFFFADSGARHTFVAPYSSPHHDELVRVAADKNSTPRSVFELARNTALWRELAADEVALEVRSFCVPSPPAGSWTEFV